MKTDFLKNLGITEQSVIDAIMAENGKDINGVKANHESLETQITELKTQLQDRDTQLADLKKSVKDNEKLTQKITELEEVNATSKTEYENKIASMQKMYAIENGVRDAKAKNVKAVMALLDMEKITFNDGKIDGLSKQIEELTKGEDTSFLFGEQKPPVPSGTEPNNPPSGGNKNNPPSGKSFSDAVAAALSGNKN